MAGIVLPTLVTSCTKVCTTALAFEGLIVTVQSPDLFADGRYEFAVNADGIEVALAVEYRDGASTCPQTDQGNACTVESSAASGRRLHATIQSSTPTMVRLNLYYVEDDALAGGPETAQLRVLRDGENIGQQRFEPTYDRDEPNGEGCGVATTAWEDFTLPAPGAARVTARSQ
jgi:hypothetical protein